MRNYGTNPTLVRVTFSSNTAAYGGGMYNSSSNPTLMNVIFRGNSAQDGGGMYNYRSDPTMTDVSFISNFLMVLGGGGGMYNEESSPTLTNVTFRGNSGAVGGGMCNGGGSPTLMNITFNDNSAYSGGGMYNGGGSAKLTNVTFSGNLAMEGDGGGLYSMGSTMLTNVTFSENSANENGGGMMNGLSSVMTLTNVTFSGNTAPRGGGMSNTGGLIIQNSILYGNTGEEIVGSGNITVSHSIIQGGYPGTGNLDADPLLGPLTNNGGFTETMALGAGSPAIDAADDAYCPAQDQRELPRPQGSACDMGAYEDGGPIHVSIGDVKVGNYALESAESMRQRYASINTGLVELSNTEGAPLIGAERVIYKVNGVNTSFSEMQALPASQLDSAYWLPWYNNVDLDTQLRFANVSNATATIHVWIGGSEMTGSPFTLEAGSSTRKSFGSINTGPVKIVSDQNIVAAERVIYKVHGVNVSFSEMMALPERQRDSTYWLPWYDNVGLDTQLRFANAGSGTANVHVYIGGTEMTGSPFTLEEGQSIRKSFAGINNGPVKIESNVPIVAAQRLIYKVNNVNTSFSEMMALPNGHSDTIYWLPWYNNVDLDSQLRVANINDTPAAIHIFIGGVEMGSGFLLDANESTQISFAHLNSGPVQIVSDIPIVATERVIYKINNIATSFSEMMAVPNGLLDTTYWLPWYNNVDLDTQLRFGMP